MEGFGSEDWLLPNLLGLQLGTIGFARPAHEVPRAGLLDHQLVLPGLLEHRLPGILAWASTRLPPSEKP